MTRQPTIWGRILAAFFRRETMCDLSPQQATMVAKDAELEARIADLECRVRSLGHRTGTLERRGHVSDHEYLGPERRAAASH